MTWCSNMFPGEELVIDGRVAVRVEVRSDGVIALFADDVPGAQPVRFLKRRASQMRKQLPGK